MCVTGVDRKCTGTLYTSYNWSLNDWCAMHGHYRSVNITSSDFLITGTEGCKCRLTLEPVVWHLGNRCASVQIELLNDLDFLEISTSVCFVPSWIPHFETFSPKAVSSYVKADLKKTMISYIRADLRKDKAKTYLENDTLTLFFELTIVKSITNSSLIYVKSQNENFATSLCENIKVIQDSKSLHDVTFVIGDKELFAHKLILAAHSEVFKAMFTSGMQEEREITGNIIDIDATVFEEFLNYMYCGKLNNVDSIVDKLIVVADKYQVHVLGVMCEKIMVSRLDTENAVEYLIIADKHCRKILKPKALEFVKANMQVFKDPANYKMLLDYPTLMDEIFTKLIAA